MRDAIITSTVLIVCIVLLRKLCKGKISAGLQYALWLIVAVRLILPGAAALFPEILPVSGFSIMKIADTIETAGQDRIEALQLPIQITLPAWGFPSLSHSDGPTSVFIAGRLPAYTWLDIVKGIWYAGMAIAAVWTIGVNIRFTMRLRKSRRQCTEKNLFPDLKLPVYLVRELSSPCLYGLPLRPGIYIPEDIIEDKEKLKHILTHEYCHYRHGDAFWSLLRSLLTIVYWFHPFVWLAAVLSKQDCELACDEAAIRMLGEEERIAYGKTLLALIVRKTRLSDIACAATTMTGGAEAVKERIRRIAEKPQRLAIVLVPLFAVIGVVIAFTFTKAREYPEGTYLLEGENARTITTDCFQITFPENFLQKVYCLGANDTDVIVYHKDSDREIGRFCKVRYEDAMRLVEERGAVLLGDYGANSVLRQSLYEQDIKEETQHSYVPANEAAQGHSYVPEDAPAGAVQGTDSNDDTTYIMEEDQMESSDISEEDFVISSQGEQKTDYEAAQASGLPPIPAPEEVDAHAEKMPFIEGEDYEAVDVDNEKEEGSTVYQPQEPVEIVYLPDEEIITVAQAPSRDLMSAWDNDCYIYLTADQSDADEALRAELSEYDRNLVVLADSVRVFYASVETMQETMRQMSENRSLYVGDFTKVSGLAGMLPTPPQLAWQKIALDTDEEPYAATVYYQMRSGGFPGIDGDNVFLQAALMFASIENLGEYRVHIDDSSGSEEISYVREDMEELFGPLYSFSETPEALTDLYNRVLNYLSGGDIENSQE